MGLMDRNTPINDSVGELIYLLHGYNLGAYLLGLLDAGELYYS